MAQALRRAVGALLAVCLLAGVAPARADGVRLIVKLKEEATRSALTPKARIEKLGLASGMRLRHLREMSQGADVLVVDGVDPAEAERIASRLAADPDVEYAEVDRRRHSLQAVPPVDDVFASLQAYLGNDPAQIRAYAAWEVTHGSSNIVVAVVDTGYRPHAAMLGRFVPGYDMISDPVVANDGDGRDADALDPGDWIAQSDQTGELADCDIRSSTWHGTSVAGVIAANPDDHAWTAGIDWHARILPVRALGRCGGYDSDIVDAIAWAAGLPVPGAPPNPTPAQVINLSLGGTGGCPRAYVDAAAAAYAHGVTRAIVAAAGNDNEDVANHPPANCPGFYAIASTTASGSRAGYSNFGAGIDLSAAAGSLSSSLRNIIVLSNVGATTPAGDSLRNEGGTSFAAPMVSATVSLMLSVAPNLTSDQVHSILVTTAQPFPGGSNCLTDGCGAGIVDAGAAVHAAAALAPSTNDNYEGLWWNAPAESESGWGINFAHQGDVIFATWFTYDATGKPWWLSMTANRTGPHVYEGALYQTHGPAFDTVPFDPAAVTATAVGSGTLSFSDASDGLFAYIVNGVAQTKPITRQVFGPLPTCTFGAMSDLTRASNYQDLWWAAPAGSESGWGVNFTQQGDIIFATWFTYDTDGSPLWLAATANRTAPGVYTGALYRTTGPAFDAVPFDPGRVVATAVGTATLTFANGDAGTFAYSVNGVAQTKPVTRQVFRAPGTVCR